MLPNRTENTHREQQRERERKGEGESEGAKRHVGKV